MQSCRAVDAHILLVRFELHGQAAHKHDLNVLDPILHAQGHSTGSELQHSQSASLAMLTT